MNSKTAIAVVGTGRMAEAYVSALKYAGIAGDEIVIVSATVGRARMLASRLGTHYSESFRDCFASAIVAVTPERTPSVCRALLASGTRLLLIEKPGALSSQELLRLACEVKQAGASASMALNRRFYNSVLKARELISADGGAVAFNFEFTDLEAHILALRAEGVWPEVNFSRWGFINPVHVIDVAFYLCGTPSELTAKRAGALEWHAAGSEFSGAGTTGSGALFSYWGTFSGAGRWRVELSTRHRKLILMPLETLQQQLTDSFVVTPVDLDPEPVGQKPGLVGVVRDFLQPADVCQLPTVEDMVGTLAVTERIFGYPESG
jgi:predicted dehydrogenase